MAAADAGAAPGHRGTRAIQRMVEYAPSTGGLALWMPHRDDADDIGDAPPIATDGHTVHYRAAFVLLPLAEQTARVANAVLHVALRHPQRLAELQQRLGDVDAELYGVCADAIVNSALDHLAWLQLPASAMRLERLLANALGGVHTPEAALLAWDVERLYLALDDRRETSTRRSGSRAAAARQLGAQPVTELRPGTPTSATAQTQADEALEWRERLVRAHTGDGAFSMLRTLLADLPKSRTPWEQVLRTQLARALAHQPGLSWSRPARSYLANQGRSRSGRRLPFEPGRTATQAVPRLVLVVDVSGSVDDGLVARFAREVEAITRRLEAGVTLVIGDDRVQQVQRFEPARCALGDIAFHGRGGTDFTPLLEEAGRHDPDLIVVLTDLQGPARHRPHAPVVWAVPEVNGAALQPFGRKLVLC